MAKVTMAVARVRQVVELGVFEMENRRWGNAGAQFELAASMTALAAGGKRVTLLAEKPERFPSAPQYSQSLDLGLDILLCFTEKSPIWGIDELAERLQSSRSTIHRYLTTLARRGEVTQEGVAGRKYRRVIADA